MCSVLGDSKVGVLRRGVEMPSSWSGGWYAKRLCTSRALGVLGRETAEMESVCRVLG